MDADIGPEPQGTSVLVSDPAGLKFGKILCCECGLPIDPNPANMCVTCLRARVDVTEAISKQASIVFCRFCSRYLSPPASWTYASLESKELLTLCLKRIKGLNKVRLVDAGFIWTEPHSKRLKVKLTVQGDVLAGAILQQTFVVEYVVTNQMCTDCQRVEAKDYWRAVVQVRQRTVGGHRKTLLYMEQLILKADLHKQTSFIKQEHGGLNFYYARQQDARRLVDFLVAHLPCQYKTAEELVTHDPKNNVFDYKHTFSVEIAPICKDHVVCLPKRLAQSLGNMGQIAVCTRISQNIHLIDPLTCQIAEISGSAFFRNPFDTISAGGVKDLTEYTVIDIEPVRENNAKSRSKVNPAGHGHISTRHALGEAWVAKSSELGQSGDDGSGEISVKTHLGHLLHPGDTVLGFDLARSNVNSQDLDKLLTTTQGQYVPDVVLVRKIYLDTQKRRRRRQWKLRHIVDGVDVSTLKGEPAQPSAEDGEYEEFLEDLEADPATRQYVNVYRKPREHTATETDEEEYPEIPLEEMLEDLHIEDEEMEPV